MKRNKLKNLAVVLACTMMLGTMPSSIDAGSLPAITQTVEAAAKKVTLKASNKKVCAGKTVKINAKAMKGAKLSYKSSNKKIATVNRNGVVTGKKAGTVKITITAKKSKYKTVKKTITVKVVKQNQKITASNVTLTIGQRKNLGAKARTPMIYKSSNPKVVSVDKKGNLKALRTGTAKIKVYAKATGTFNKASRTITVKVTKKTAAKPTTPKPVVKPTTTPKPVQPETKPAEKPEQTETPSQPETKPTEKPEQTETPSQPETKPTEKPEQTEAPDNTSYVVELGIEKTADDTIYIGEAKECNVKWKATGNTTRKDFIYTSSDPSVATIDENGNITGVKAGKVIITVTSKTPFAKGGSCLDTFKKYTVKAHYNDAYESGVGFKNPSNVDEKGRNVGIGETINPNRGITRYDAENAEKYLTFEHDEFTMKPALDEAGRLILREDYRIATMNCGEEDFAVACMRANLRYGKNQKREDVKSHHYIISFDPRDAAEKRIAELSAIFKRLYEDSVTGRISDERFAELSADYEAEQKQVKSRAAELQAELAKAQEATVNAEKFMKVVRKYTSFEELTHTLLREIIEKIVVHECSYDENGTRRQDIDIYYSFVGKVELPDE